MKKSNEKSFMLLSLGFVEVLTFDFHYFQTENFTLINRRIQRLNKIMEIMEINPITSTHSVNNSFYEVD